MEITYWSDYACPYCYIGETRLKKAIEKAGLSDDVTLDMRAFQLDPGAPVHAAGDTISRYATKYGQTAEQAAKSVAEISALGEAEGLPFQYADTQFTNTMDAHRLTKLAKSKPDPKIAEKLSDLLFKAYFSEGKELANHDVLCRRGSKPVLLRMKYNSCWTAASSLPKSARTSVKRLGSAFMAYRIS